MLMQVFQLERKSILSMKQNIFMENIIFFHFTLDIYFFFGIFAHYIYKELKEYK